MEKPNTHTKGIENTQREPQWAQRGSKNSLRRN